MAKQRVKTLKNKKTKNSSPPKNIWTIVKCTPVNKKSKSSFPPKSKPINKQESSTSAISKTKPAKKGAKTRKSTQQQGSSIKNTHHRDSSASEQRVVAKRGELPGQKLKIQSITTNRLSTINRMRRANALHKVVFVRHGQSTWNLENRFTGWHDVDLTAQGVEEAKAAGQLLKEHGFEFDLAHTSVLKRAIKTYNTMSEEMGSLFIPHYKSWRLNERSYGALQGLNKAETAEKHGEEQVLKWRRSYDIPPPELALDDERHPAFDRRYGDLSPDVLPCTESLKITVDRVLPYWYDTICPQVIQGKSVVVVAHGNSLRAIVKYLAGMSEEEILAYNIPTACPLVFEFDQDMRPLKNYYLLDEAELKARQEAVANQAKVRV